MKLLSLNLHSEHNDCFCIGCCLNVYLMSHKGTSYGNFTPIMVDNQPEI